jgi:PilZ domain
MVRCPERRNLERFPVVDMKASISVRYRFGTHHGDVVDFNRYGITVVLRRPIAVNKPLFVELKYGGLRLEGIVGAAHHCRFTTDGMFRCGIRFRTNSPIQLDRDEIDVRLESVERTLMELFAAAST